MKIAPSILNADFLNLGSVLSKLNEADYIHVDIMDGNFVPNISFGPDITYQISKAETPALDIHLMVLNPLEYIDAFAKSNPEFITIHVESHDFEAAFKRIKSHGIKTGVSIKPGTEIDAIKHVLDQADLVLVMSVEPGFGGQKFMASSLDKIKELVHLRKDNQFNYLIEVDGGIDDTTAPLVKEAGVDIAVVGSYLMKQKNHQETIKKLR